MKAIDILRNHIRDLEKMVLVFDEYAMYKSRDESKKAIQELTQVIVELEDLEVKDRLAELEKVILDYYLAKGYQVGVGGWGFSVQINSDYKDKNIEVFFSDKQNNEKEFDSVVTIMEETTKKMFDKAFEYFGVDNAKRSI